MPVPVLRLARLASFGSDPMPELPEIVVYIETLGPRIG